MMFIGDKFDKAAVLATLQANAERKPKAQFKQDTIGKLIDIQSRMTEGKGIGYKRWLTKHNLKVMAQTVNLLQEKGLTDEDALNQRIAELETKYHDSLAVVKDLEGRMKATNELRYHIAAYTSTKNVAQQLKTAKRPAAFEEQHRAELTAYRVAAAYFKANNITKLPSPKKLEAEYAQLASEKAISITQWVIVDEVVQFGLLCHGDIQYILDPSTVNGDFSPIPEQQLHTPGIHIELTGSFIVLHVRVLSALRHLYSCDFRYTILLMLIAHKTKFWVPTALRAGIGSQQPSHPLQRGWL